MNNIHDRAGSGIAAWRLTGTEIAALDRLAVTDGRWAEGACVVVVPALDEVETLPRVLAAMPSDVAGLRVLTLVVSDGSSDGTDRVAEEAGARVIARTTTGGSGAATRLGYRAAIDAGASIVVTMDADGQHDPRELGRVVEPVVDGRADMAQGSRVIGSFERASAARVHGVRLFSWVLSALARTRITDPSTGYRAVAADALARLDLSQDQFYVPELILDAVHKGLRVLEVPISMRARAAGVTKKPRSFRYGWGFANAVLRTARRHRRAA